MDWLLILGFVAWTLVFAVWWATKGLNSEEEHRLVKHRERWGDPPEQEERPR